MTCGSDVHMDKRKGTSGRESLRTAGTWTINGTAEPKRTPHFRLLRLPPLLNSD
jgi:hypothetical protein